MRTSLPTYARWYERLVAYVLDVLILLLPSAMLVGALGTVNANDELIPAPETTALIFLINMAYYTFFTGSRYQATLGMRAMNIHIVRLNGRKLTQLEGLERFLAFSLPSLPVYASFLPENVAQPLVVMLSMYWFLPILSTPTRAAIHDRLCHMRVITGKAAP